MTLAHEIRDYAHDLIADHILHEYKTQIGIWQKEINLLVDAKKIAFGRFNATMSASMKQRNRSDRVAMIAMSLVGGVALSWVTARVQYKIVPKYTQKLADGSEWRFVYNRHIERQFETGGIGIPLRIEGPASHNKVAAKIFGDLTKKFVSPLLKVGTQAISNTTKKVDDAVFAPEESLRTRLENAMLAESKLVENQIMGLAMKILHSETFGKQWLDLADGDELKAKALIREQLNKVRRMWAKEWFYYGRLPYHMEFKDRVDAIEREMWAVWLAGELVDLKKVSGGEASWMTRKGHRRTTGLSLFDEPFISSAILKQLRKVNAVQTVQESYWIHTDGTQHEARLWGAKRTAYLYDHYKRLREWALKHQPTNALPSKSRHIVDVLRIHQR